MKKTLNVSLVLCGLIPFFMGVELLNPLYAYLYLISLFASLLIDAGKIKRPSRAIINFLAISLLVSVVTQVRYDSIVEGFMESILVMCGIKMLEEKRWRDYGETLLLFLMLLAAYAMLSFQKLFVFYSFGILLFGSFSQILASALEKEPTLSLSKKELLQIFKSAFRILLTMLPIAIVIFFITPRMNYVAHNFNAVTSKSGTVGFSDQVRLGDVASIQRNNAVVFRAETAPVAPKHLYWRGMVMDSYLGNMWAASPVQNTPTEFRLNGKRVEQSIYMEPGYHRYYFALDIPAVLSGVDYRAIGSSVFQNTDARVTKRRHYTAYSFLSDGLFTEMREGEFDFYLKLPPDVSERVRELTRQLVADKESQQEKVQAIKEFLAPPFFSYSLENLPMTENPLETFLFDERRGTCEYFASAMGVMLRMAGIPSRLVAGYLGGVYSEAGGYYIVTQGGAHVWVEVWDSENKAWVRHDPTPQGIPGETGGGVEDIGTLALYWDLMDYHWARLFVNYDSDKQAEMVEALKEAVRNPGKSLSPQQLTERLKKSFKGKGHALAWFLLMVIGGGSAYLYFKTRKRPEIRLLFAFQREMQKKGYSMQAGQGILEFAEQVEEDGLRGAAIDFAKTFASLYYTDTLFTPDSINKLEQQLKALRQYR